MSKEDKLIRVPGETLFVDESPAEIKYRKNHWPAIKDVTRKKLLCTVCSCDVSRNIFKGKKIFIHNILGVLLCEECQTFYGDGCFSMDEDGDDKYCRWCGQGGSLFCCAKCSCAFCKKCIKKNLNRSVLNDVEKDDWECLICQPKPLYEVRSLCWAASKYFDLVNEKREKLKKESENKKNEPDNVTDDDCKKSQKRNRQEDSDNSVEPKRSKYEKSDGKEKPKQTMKKVEKETSGDDSFDKKRKTQADHEKSCERYIR